jgi:pimeloyl-ACP methyl ester carboxylesterase
MRIAIVMIVLTACSTSRHEHVRTSSAPYRDAAMWLCRPDLPTDACRGDLTTTEIAADNTRTVVPHPIAAERPVDCFYIYPTVDLSLIAGNHTDFTDITKQRDTAEAQVARFSEVCNIYAPLYRQATIATYLDPSKDDATRIFDVAYSDVAAAFHAYLTHYDRGRPIVIIGHSQGSQMAARLLHDTFDQDAKLKARLLVAFPIGFTVDVPDGATTGGTFQTLAPCASRDAINCYVAYMSIAAGDEPSKLRNGTTPAKHHAACVDPAEGELLGESIFPTKKHGAKYNITTPYVSVKGFYRAHCDDRPDGRDYFEIAEARAPGDQRPSFVNLDKNHGGLGLHIYDFQFAQGDLIELVKHKLEVYRQQR